ncbi:MAG: hypothetical protein OIF56_15525 [Cohaesibacter sp.]|nr:hypothetical protein [Cohaesibacter sp.]MCV6601918.1 hypothetical protein [Cohaesibacter sp.]
MQSIHAFAFVLLFCRVAFKITIMKQDLSNQAFEAPNPHDEMASDVDARPLIIWSSVFMSAIAVVGLFLWSKTGTAVFFDRISGAIAGCF